MADPNSALLVNLEICNSRECSQCEIDCQYFYHPANNGINWVRELAAFKQYCRQCESGACVDSCSQEALKRGKDGVVTRANFLCIGCDSCVMACPFGTILNEFLEFRTSICDGGCKELAKQSREPLCAKTCPYQAVSVGAFEEDPSQNIRRLSSWLFVKEDKWERTTEA